VRHEVLTAPLPDELLEEVVIASTCFIFEANQQSRTLWRHVAPNFRNVFNRPEIKTFTLGERTVSVEYAPEVRSHKDTLQDASVLFTMSTLGKSHKVLFDRPFSGVELVHNARQGTVQGRVNVVVDGRRASYFALYLTLQNELALHTMSLGKVVRLKVTPRLVLPQSDVASSANVVTAPMTGKIVSLAVAAGQAVKKGDLLYVMESMKMETKIVAQRDGTIAEVLTNPGVVIDEGKAIMTYEATKK